MTNEEWNQAELEQQEQMSMTVYTDYIADKCHKALRSVEGGEIVMCVVGIRHHVEDDKLISHTKQFVLMDINKKMYRVTVEVA
jgi:hypothetical protein